VLCSKLFLGNQGRRASRCSALAPGCHIPRLWRSIATFCASSTGTETSETLHRVSATELRTHETPLEKSFFSFAQKVFTVIRMDQINSGFSSPLVDVDAKIIERYTIGIKRGTVRSKYTDVLRREV